MAVIIAIPLSPFYLKEAIFFTGLVVCVFGILQLFDFAAHLMDDVPHE